MPLPQYLKTLWQENKHHAKNKSNCKPALNTSDILTYQSKKNICIHKNDLTPYKQHRTVTTMNTNAHTAMLMNIFPDMDEDVIRDVLAANNGDLAEATQILSGFECESANAEDGFHVVNSKVENREPDSVEWVMCAEPDEWEVVDNKGERVQSYVDAVKQKTTPNTPASLVRICHRISPLSVQKPTVVKPEDDLVEESGMHDYDYETKAEHRISVNTKKKKKQMKRGKKNKKRRN